jgi:hypothetical protein
VYDHVAGAKNAPEPETDPRFTDSINRVEDP